MSDPTQSHGHSHGTNPDTANSDQDGSGSEQASPSAANQGGNEPLRAQAYVDPSIAAEAQQSAAEAEIADLKDKLLRAHAEMDNLRKRTEREKADTSKYAISKFAGDVLAVADNLQRALAAFAGAEVELDPKTKALIDGVELTEAELAKALERHGVKKVEALGAIFDPNFHQAVMEEENKDIAAGTVLRVFQEGYQIGSRLLRPSMVVVARGGFKPVKAAETRPAANDDAPLPAGDAEAEMPETNTGSNGDPNSTSQA